MRAILVAVLFAVSAPNPSDVQATGSNQTPPTEQQNETSPHPTAIAAQSGDEWQDAKQYERGHRNAFLSWCQKYESVINLLSGVAVAAFTGILTLYTVLLWRSGEKHSERELRAYVFVNNAKIHRLTVNDYIEGIIRIQNGGQTPAYEFNSRSAVWIDKCPSYTFPVEEWIPSTISMGPGTTRDLRPCSRERLTAEQWGKIDTGELAIYVAGEMQYKDAFGRSRTTYHRGFFFNHRQEWSLDGDLPIRPSEDGNSAT